MSLFTHGSHKKQAAARVKPHLTVTTDVKPDYRVAAEFDITKNEPLP